MANDLVYLGVLAAPTGQGRRAVAVALTGAVELYHLVDAGFSEGSASVENWLWSAGINPEESYAALPVDMMISEILLPEIGRRTLVVPHSDMDVSLVDSLVSAMGRQGNPAIVSGIELTGPLALVCNGTAGRRAFALQARYESALEEARSVPAVHVVDGTLVDGRIASMSVSGPFAKGSWTLDEDDDAMFLMMWLVGISGFATFEVKDGPAAAALRRLAEEVGMEWRIAA